MTEQFVTTDKPVALRFQIELEFGNVGFEEGKTGEPREKPREAWTRTNNKLNSHNYDTESANKTQATVGGKCSLICAIPYSLRLVLP